MGSTITIKRMSAVLTFALASLLLAASTAFAQYPPAADFGVSCVPEVPAVGATVNCAVVGAVAGEDLHATAAYNPVFFEADLVADDEGTAAFAFDVPAEAEGEDIVVTVVGSESGSTGTELEVVTDPDDATDPTDPATAAPSDDAAPSAQATPVTAADDLPRTGIESSWLIAGGALLLALGVVTVTAARRRDRGRASA